MNRWAYERDLEEGTERAERLSREVEDESLEAAINDHDPAESWKPCRPGCPEMWDIVGGPRGSLGFTGGFTVYRCRKCGREDWL